MAAKAKKGFDSLLAAGAVLMAVAIALDVVTLTSAPALFLDEAFIASRLQSFGAGGDFFPVLATDYGIYEGGADLWGSRVGSMPLVVGEMLGPSTFTAYRATVLATALAGVAIFWFGLREAHGAAAACFGSAALVATWAFLSASHWIRWDGTGMLFACAILALLLRGPPRVGVSLGLGLLIGLCSDFVYPMIGLSIGAALLVSWEPEDRWRRLGALGAGVGLGLAAFYAIHVLPDPALSDRQYETLYEPVYGETPLIEAVKSFSAEPILREGDRYGYAIDSLFRPNVYAIFTGLVASLLVLLALIGVRRRTLAVLGFPALTIAMLLTLADHESMYEHYYWVFGVLRYVHHFPLFEVLQYGIFVLLAASVVAIGVLVRRRFGDEYPQAAVGPILLVSLLISFGLLHAYKVGNTYTDFALPFVVAATIAVAEQLLPARRELAVAATMTLLLAAGGSHFVERIADTRPEAALDDDLERTAREIVPDGATVMGDWNYWWLYRDERFRINSSIWFQAFLHPDEGFEQSFHRVCPDYVLLDPVWLVRYEETVLAQFAPNQNPSDPAERARLERLLDREYALVREVETDGREISFWRRAAPSCPPPG